MEKVNKDLSSQHNNGIDQGGKVKSSGMEANNSSNRPKKTLSDAEIREHRLAMQEKARKVLRDPIKKQSASSSAESRPASSSSSSVSKKTSESPSKYHRASLIPASELGLKPLSQKMEDILAAKNNINYTKRDISGLERRKHKKKKKDKEKGHEHSRKKLERRLEPVPKKPKFVKHSARQVNMKPLSFDEILKQANDNKGK